MRNRFKLIVLFTTLIVIGTSMAVVCKLIPVQAAALISIITVVVIGAVVSRRSIGLRVSSKKKAVSVWGLVWPLLLGAAVAIVGVWREGWKLGDTIGATVCFLLLAAYLLVYRKQRDDG
jgi:hypothetical protein